jgi:hypothetical protein
MIFEVDFPGGDIVLVADTNGYSWSATKPVVHYMAATGNKKKVGREESFIHVD